MTDSYQLFSLYSTYVEDVKIKIADDSLSSIVGKGSIRILNSITLDFVLHILSLSYNLLSISQLMKNSNALQISCVFQGFSSEKTISSTKEFGGLYYFKEDDVSKLGQLISCNSTTISRDVKFCYSTIE